MKCLELVSGVEISSFTVWIGHLFKEKVRAALFLSGHNIGKPLILYMNMSTQNKIIGDKL